MSFFLKLLIISVIIVFCVQSSLAEVIYSDEEIQSIDTRTYTVESIGPDLDPDELVINNKIYDPKTYCDIAVGDPIKFIESPPYDCVDAKLLNLRTKKVCYVWCD